MFHRNASKCAIVVCRTFFYIYHCFIFKNFFRMTEDEIGEYICQATLSTNQRAFVNTKISLRPEIILSRGEIRTLEEGENVYLECAFVKGIHGTRVWKRDNKIFYEFGSDRISYQNHGGLLEIKNARPSDSGNYSCEGKYKYKYFNCVFT